MKRVWITVIALLCFATPVQALRAVNADMLGEAQEYGQRFFKQDTADFLLPWTVYEEKTGRINAQSERAYFYTPYLLLALHTRDSVQKNSSVYLVESEKILSDYTGFFVFEVMLYSTKPDFADGITAWLKQGKRLVKHHQIILALGPEAVEGLRGESIYRTQWYMYFPDGKVNKEKPVKLVVTIPDKRDRNFIFNLPVIR